MKNIGQFCTAHKKTMTEVHVLYEQVEHACWAKDVQYK